MPLFLDNGPGDFKSSLIVPVLDDPPNQC
jgi:hypothetical protein